MTVISKDQNVIEYLNKLHTDDSITDNTVINNSMKSTSGWYKISKQINCYKFIFMKIWCLGMKYISHDISIPSIPLLMNKSIVIIHAFVSLKDIYISVPFNVSEVNKFIKEFSLFCLTCMYISPYIFILI